jgi:hypothetical protein
MNWISNTWFLLLFVLLLLQDDDTIWTTAFSPYRVPLSTFKSSSVWMNSKKPNSVIPDSDPKNVIIDTNHEIEFVPHSKESSSSTSSFSILPILFSVTLVGITVYSQTSMTTSTAWAFDASSMSNNNLIQLPGLTPSTFQPVCPASDGLYRFLQGTTESIVGRENFIEYGPLIAGGLLRVRLELCVVESFFNEAVGPFIQQNGLSWVLPIHETVESFLAGTIFALASTFILVGSTKILTVIITYADVFVGIPLRTIGGFALDRAQGKPITVDVGIGPFQTRLIGPPKDSTSTNESNPNDGKKSPLQLVSTLSWGSVKAVGETSRIVREVMEGLDLFVGRYLVLIATGYIGLKFLHFKVFPDFP